MVHLPKWIKSSRQTHSSSSSSPSPPETPSLTAPTLFTLLSSKARQKAPQRQQRRILSAALTIPEVVLAIAAFLNRPSLLSCSYVCKDWYLIFHPLLFRVVEGTDFDHPDFTRAFKDYTRAAASIEWIQGSSLVMPTSKHPWYRLFCKKTLIPPIVTNEKLFSQLVSSLLAGPTPKLKTLSVRIHNHDPNLVLNLSAKTISNLQINTKSYPGKKPRMYMEDILQAYPNLIHLVLEGLFSLSSHRLENEHSHGGSSSSPSVPPAISSSNAALSVLHVLGAGSSSQMSQASYRTTSNDNAQGNGIKDEGTVLSYSIRTLKLRLVDISQEGLIALSPLLPNLTSLLIEEFLAPNMMVKIYRWTWTTEFIHSLKDAFPHLRSLRFAFPFDNIKEDTIIEILRSFPLLTEVGFRNSHFGRRALETLQEHCRHVVSLDISFACPERGFKGALIRFLQTWPQLREFIADGMIFHLDEPEDDGVLRVPWACTNLEKLVCGFHGTEPMIFEYLSAFPKMSNLTISYPPLSISPVESTLAWITKSSKMEYFWFVQHRHPPLGKSSVRWILKHWPNLKKLHVAGGTTEQKETVKQWCRDAHRLSLAVEYDLF